MHLPNHLHRKGWEWCAIVQALEERDMLMDGRVGCGFAVGKEPLASLFASLDTKITATDAPPSEVDGGWVATDQHASSLEDLYRPNIVPKELFRENVRFQYADMRDPSTFPHEQYDFIWSSCAFEHLGTLDAGHRFVIDSADKLLRAGGIAVHTTEFNVSSNDETIVDGPFVLYRRKDLDRLGGSLRRVCCGMVPIDYDSGFDPDDLNYDYLPYGNHGRRHIKLLVSDYVVTSAMIIIQKG
jgi:SAM-dependent methyltransferase